MKNIIIAGAVIVVIVAGVMLFMRSGGNGVPIETVQILPSLSPSSSPDVSSSPVSVQGVKEFTVIGTNYSFTPKIITVNKGDKVKITFKDNGGFHDLVIDGLNVATERINQGGMDVVEFTADMAGSFEYYCSVGSHRQQGMFGTLIVQ